MRRPTPPGPGLRPRCYDLYLGTLFRWVRDEFPPEGAFAAALDRAIDLALHGVAIVLERPRPGVDGDAGTGTSTARNGAR